MMLVADFPRELAWRVPQGFLSYAPQPDFDLAFDEAVLADQMDLGSLAVVPSLAGTDPSTVERDDTPMHPHAALRKALRELPEMRGGLVLAQSIRALKDYKHTRVRVNLEDPTIAYPDEPGFLWEYEAALDEAARLAGLAPGQSAVSAAIPREGSRKYLAAAKTSAGGRVTSFGLYEGEDLLAEYASASEARRHALSLARAKGAPSGTWHVNPVVRKEGGRPFIEVTRTLVKCRIPAVVNVAEEKDADRVTHHGWLFYGKSRAEKDA